MRDDEPVIFQLYETEAGSHKIVSEKTGPALNFLPQQTLRKEMEPGSTIKQHVADADDKGRL